MAHWEVRRSKLLRRWHVVLVGDNGEPLSSSEVLNSRDAVETNIAAQREAATSDEVIWR